MFIKSIQDKVTIDEAYLHKIYTVVLASKEQRHPPQFISREMEFHHQLLINCFKFRNDDTENVTLEQRTTIKELTFYRAIAKTLIKYVRNRG